MPGSRRSRRRAGSATSPSSRDRRPSWTRRPPRRRGSPRRRRQARRQRQRTRKKPSSPRTTRAFRPPPRPGTASGGCDTSTRMTAEQMFEEIRGLAAQARNAHVRALLLSFLDDPELRSGFLRAPAAKSIHHAFPGGLCEHTLSVLQLGWRACDHYPQLDRDLVAAGCLLHDFGKAKEISPEPPFEYTDEGKLVGHLVLTCQLIREKASRIPGFSPELEWRVTHLIAAHHGRYENGSPKEPATLEAMVVHAVDELDSRISSFGQLFAAAQGPWTDRKNPYGRQLLVPPAPAEDMRRFEGAGVYREVK